MSVDGSTGISGRVRNRYRSDGLTGVVASGYSTIKRTAAQFCYDLVYRRRTDAPVDKLLWVDPETIEYFSGIGVDRSDAGRHLEYLTRPWYHQYARRGDVLGGDWDRPRVPVTAVAEWRLLIERFVEGRSWDATSVYEELVARLARGEPVYGCSTVEELHDRFAYLESVKASMERTGYRRQTALTAEGVGVDEFEEGHLDEITVDIGRDGRLLHRSNGRHRLALAQILDLSAVPVLVHVRHARWQRIRRRARNGSGHPEHPDLVEFGAPREQPTDLP